MSDAFEQWAADKSFMLRVNDRDGYVGYVNVREMALEAWQAALQSGEPVGWQFYDNGNWFNGMPGDHRANTEAAGVPVRDLYTTPQPVVDVNQKLVRKYEKLEPALEALVNLCNNFGIGTYDEVIAAEAALERLYLARKTLLSAGKETHYRKAVNVEAETYPNSVDDMPAGKGGE
jgi:hypothetical protein